MRVYCDFNNRSRCWPGRRWGPPRAEKLTSKVVLKSRAGQDSGTGMTPEVLVHVMEPFYTTKDASTGDGLGLSMTYGVIQAHGGNIEIASQPGQCTTV